MTSTPHDDGSDWFAMHVFLSDAQRADAFLLDWLAPQVQTLLAARQARSWFFVRYWDGGPHLRVRLQGLGAAARAALLANTRAAVPAYTNPQPPSRDSYYAHHGFDGRPLDPATLAWHAEGSVVVLPYEPEWVRYGGVPAMAVNERLFDLSSTLAVPLLHASRGDPLRRLAQAASVMPMFALGWQADVHKVASFFETYAAFWEAYSPQTRAFAQQLAQVPAAVSSAQCEVLARQVQAAAGAGDTSLRSPQALLRAGVAAAIAQWAELHATGRLVLPFNGQPAQGPGAWDACVQSMLSSQLHMLNNRLGLVPAQEVVLARGIARTARALQRQAEAANEQVDEVLS